MIGLLYAMGVTVILIIPVVLMAALLGGRLVRRRSQRIAGGVVGAVTVLVGAAGLYASSWTCLRWWRSHGQPL
ncbi:hypothetical protein JCM18918_4213 [Cutibacterium acnes JCM 18918]|nr:hypothetical protein JCM18918_4213 [Cutibacterium acnes JCM 18918]